MTNKTSSAQWRRRFILLNIYELSVEGGVFSKRLKVLKAEIAEITPPTKNNADPPTNDTTDICFTGFFNFFL